MVGVLQALLERLSSLKEGEIDVQLVVFACEKLIRLDQHVGNNFTLLSLIWKGALSLASNHWKQLQHSFKTEEACAILLHYCEEGLKELVERLSAAGYRQEADVSSQVFVQVVKLLTFFLTRLSLISALFASKIPPALSKRIVIFLCRLRGWLDPSHSVWRSCHDTNAAMQPSSQALQKFRGFLDQGLLSKADMALNKILVGPDMATAGGLSSQGMARGKSQWNHGEFAKPFLSALMEVGRSRTPEKSSNTICEQALVEEEAKRLGALHLSLSAMEKSISFPPSLRSRIRTFVDGGLNLIKLSYPLYFSSMALSNSSSSSRHADLYIRTASAYLEFLCQSVLLDYAEVQVRLSRAPVMTKIQTKILLLYQFFYGYFSRSACSL